MHIVYDMGIHSISIGYFLFSIKSRSRAKRDILEPDLNSGERAIRSGSLKGAESPITTVLPQTSKYSHDMLSDILISQFK